MPFHELGDVELWLFEHLDLSDVAILDGEDAGGLAGNLLTGGCANEFLDEGSQVTLGSELRHDGGHFGTDGTNLSRLGVARVLDLVGLRSGKGDAEHSDNVSVRGAAVDSGFDDGLLFPDQTAKLVACHVHAVKVQKTIVALYVLDTKLDFAISKGLVLVEVGQGDFKDTPFETFTGNFGTLSFGDQGTAAIFDGEHAWSNQLVPFLLEKGILSLFTASLFGLCQTLILSL